MGRTYFENKKKLKAYLVQDTQSGAKKIYRMYLGSERIYPNAGMVTYHVDTNVTYTEEVDIDESILNPSTFTPSKSGWTFVGWRKDTAANGSVLSNEVMTGDDVVLYAVFQQNITLSYNGNGATSGSTANQSGTRYYNNGNASNPSFVLRNSGYSRTGYNFTNWRMGSTSGTAYNAGASVTLSANTTFYASWIARTVSKTITKTVTTAINNWSGCRTLVLYDGNVFVSNPTITMDSNDTVRVNQKTYSIIVANHATGGGTWTVNVTAKGTAYEVASASGIGTASGQFTATIDNWSGGTRTINFGRTFKSPPVVNWYTPDPSRDSLAEDWTINITNITTTGFTISWGANTGSASHELGWIAEGAV